MQQRCQVVAGSMLCITWRKRVIYRWLTASNYQCQLGRVCRC